MNRLALFALSIVAAPALGAGGEVVGFEDLSLALESAWNGPDPDGVIVDGLHEPEVLGAFRAGGVEFVNRQSVDPTSDSWNGFAYSNVTDTSNPGLANQFSAAPGGGLGQGGAADPGGLYGVGFGYLDPFAHNAQPFAFDLSDPEQLWLLPSLTLPFGRTVQNVAVTNTAWTADVLLNGDANNFAKRFGGPTGSDPDWLKLTAHGVGTDGAPLAATAEFYLADYRFASSADDYVVTDWVEWDLSSLADARSLHFNLASSDTGQFGMNTPGYFAIDDLTLDVLVTPGDYNLDGAVDAADYTVWRDAEGETVTLAGLGADGDLSGVVDLADNDLWRAAYDAAQATAIPEPTTTLLLISLPTTLLTRNLLTRNLRS